MQNEEKLKKFTDLKAWQEGHSLVLRVYKISKDFPKTEAYGLTSQIRRSAVSVTSNLAEGFTRDSYTDKCRFYVMAHGSLTELENQLIIARNVGYVETGTYESVILQVELVYRIISGLIRATKERK